MKLEHLAPYLPYGLKVQLQSIKETLALSGLDGNDVLLIGWGRFNSSEIKPILRPLSDLTKEIEHNGEKFVPFEEFIKACFIFPIKEDNFYNLPYGIIQNLFKWHFDVFGLIEKGEAIDINTLKK